MSVQGKKSMQRKTVWLCYSPENSDIEGETWGLGIVVEVESRGLRSYHLP